MRRENDSSAGIQVQVLDRQIPVSFQDFEAALFFFLVGFLIGIELLDQRGAVKIVVGNRGVLKNNRHAVIPAAVLGGLKVSNSYAPLQQPAQFDVLLQNRVMVH